MLCTRIELNAMQNLLWPPSQKLLVAAGNFYWCLPHLYTIRGTSFRSLRDWYQSLVLRRGLKADYPVTCKARTAPAER